jgi:bifunctional UDP-N-acetylglucosamine pyrophosphorylase / glucosamine-1-phosphate N-acetyltransferase
MDLHVVILAAGLGKRMQSDLPKVLHRVAGRPLLYWPVALAQEIGAASIVVVLGHGRDAVAAALEARFPRAVTTVLQDPPRGTGDAVRHALAALPDNPDARVLILSGDVPLLTRATVDRLLTVDAPLGIVTMRPPSPEGYGRVLRDRDRVVGVVEHRDATADERAVGEVNAGIYAVRLGFLRQALATLGTDNAQGEIYLTDIVARAPAVGVVDAPFEEVSGINDRVELAQTDATARRQIAERWMRRGVTIIAPETVCIEADVELARDVEIGPGVSLRGSTTVGAGAKIDVGCVLTDTVVASGATLRPYSVMTSSTVGARAQIGPFSHLRPGSDLGPDVHLGNFVETKKARLGAGSKANHLAYLGDAEIGERVNVGAGTITCNYDGQAKHTTVIEDGAFIGSDTQLVAPVRVGKGAYVAAGTTVTEDVPDGALVLTRAPLTVKQGYDQKRKARERKGT